MKQKMAKWSFRTQFFVVTAIVVTTLYIIFYSNFLKYESDAFQDARAAVSSNKEVIERIGTVKRYGFWVSGNLDSPRGFSMFKFDVIGEKGEAEVTVKMEKNRYGGWTVTNIAFED